MAEPRQDPALLPFRCESCGERFATLAKWHGHGKAKATDDDCKARYQAELYLERVEKQAKLHLMPANWCDEVTA